MAVNKDMKILVVDDYKTMIRIIRNLLKQLGFNNVEEATDGGSALIKLRDGSLTGFQLLKEVRADVKLAALPFIMVTAESKTENVIAAKQAGVSNYIVKPFNAATLKAKLIGVLGDF